MASWYFLSGLAVAFALLAGRGSLRKRAQEAAANAAGLVPVRDLQHVPVALQHTALWSLAEGGFERRAVHGVVTRANEDIDVTAFDLETLRERRGEWAWLPVDDPFRVGGVVSVVVCDIDRKFPHYLIKRAGHGDEMRDDTRIERSLHVAKLARDRLGLGRSYPAELPPTLAPAALAVELPEQWRAYGTDPQPLAELLAAGFGATLARAGRRDLVVEIVDSIVVIYPAARDVATADAFADLTETALAVVDGLLDASRLLHLRDPSERA